MWPDFERSMRRAWHFFGPLKSVIVANRLFPELERFVAENGNLSVQLEPSLIPGSTIPMSMDCITRLHSRFDTEEVLIVQNDGYPVRAGLEEFSGRYDFIGAPSVRPSRQALLAMLGLRSLCGGFSLRTKRICVHAAKAWRFWRFFINPQTSRFFAEDVFYTTVLPLNPFFRMRYRIAPYREARIFAYDSLGGEVSPPDGVRPLALHGKHTLAANEGASGDGF